MATDRLSKARALAEEANREFTLGMARDEVIEAARDWRDGDFSFDRAVGWHDRLGAAVDRLNELEGS